MSVNFLPSPSQGRFHRELSPLADALGHSPFEWPWPNILTGLRLWSTIMYLWPTSSSLTSPSPPSRHPPISDSVSPCPQSTIKIIHSPGGLTEAPPAGEKREEFSIIRLQRNPVHRCALWKSALGLVLHSAIYSYSILAPLLQFPVYFLSHVCSVGGTCLAHGKYLNRHLPIVTMWIINYST